MTGFKMIYSLMTSALLLTSAYAAPLLKRDDTSGVLPNFLVPIYKDNPSNVAGTQYNATVSLSPQVSMLIGFDLPATTTWTQCQLQFANITVQAPGKIDTYTVAPNFNLTTASWANRPSRQFYAGLYTIGANGSSTPPALPQLPFFPCSAGRTNLELAANANGTTFTWFEQATPFVGVVLTQYVA